MIIRNYTGHDVHILAQARVGQTGITDTTTEPTWWPGEYTYPAEPMPDCYAEQALPGELPGTTIVRLTRAARETAR